MLCINIFFFTNRIDLDFKSLWEKFFCLKIEVYEWLKIHDILTSYLVNLLNDQEENKVNNMDFAGNSRPGFMAA